MHKHAQDVAEARATSRGPTATRYPDTRRKEGIALPCHVVSLSNAVQSSPLSPTTRHCFGVHVGWSEPSSLAEVNMTERWQCNHVDHKAGQQAAAATGCNVILQLVCSSALRLAASALQLIVESGCTLQRISARQRVDGVKELLLPLPAWLCSNSNT